MFKFDASIVIPTYNRPDLLKKTLESLVEDADEGLTSEVVVVDDGSSQDNVGIIRAFEAQIPIKYIYQPDRGFQLARARNLGAKIAEGAIAIFLDTGIVVAKGFTAAHVRSHRGASHDLTIGYVYGFSQTNDQEREINEIVFGRSVDEAVSLFQERPELADIREVCYARCSDELQNLRAPWALAWACNLSIRIESYGVLNGFDENYRSWGAEDIDFGLNAFRHGLSLKLIRDAVAIHLPHPKTLSDHGQTAPANKRYLHAKFGMKLTEELIDTSCVALNLRA